MAGERERLANGTDPDCRCPACGADGVSVCNVPFPLFRHLDFTRLMADAGQFGECAHCGAIFRIARQEAFDELDALYRSQAYAKHDEAHAIAVPGSEKPVPASQVQADALEPLLPDIAPRILDFGCFNGRLLRAFHERRSNATLVGYDVAERDGFPEGDAFTFVSGDWRAIEGPFDLICLSHSIQYVAEIADLLARIREWLGPDGAVYVQTPDISRKSCALLLGDLHYHFSAPSLLSLMHGLGFEVTLLSELPFPSDAAVLGRVAPAAGFTPSGTGNVLADAMADIVALSDTISAIGQRSVDGILGTTIEAAFVDELLECSPRYFVDENPERIGDTFRGRPVVAPGDAASGATVLVPLGDRAAAVASRLSDKSPADFLPL